VVDAEDLRFVQDLPQLAVEIDGGPEVAAEGLLDE
jgi:hypothetical protein